MKSYLEMIFIVEDVMKELKREAEDNDLCLNHVLIMEELLTKIKSRVIERLMTYETR